MTIQETKNRLVDVINNSGLAIDVMDLILENLYSIVHRQTEEAYAHLQNMRPVEENAVEEHAVEAEKKKGVKKDGSN